MAEKITDDGRNYVCARCEILKPRSEFYSYPRNKSRGVTARCKPCHKISDGLYKQKKPVEQLKAAHREAARLFRLRHGDRLKAKAARLRERNKQYVNSYKAERGCCNCGERDPVVLEFHHRDPKEKKFEVCQHGERGLSAIQTEIAKCDLLCANCHRREHHRKRHGPEN